MEALVVCRKEPGVQGGSSRAGEGRVVDGVIDMIENSSFYPQRIWGDLSVHSGETGSRRREQERMVFLVFKGLYWLLCGEQPPSRIEGEWLLMKGVRLQSGVVGQWEETAPGWEGSPTPGIAGAGEDCDLCGMNGEADLG